MSYEGKYQYVCETVSGTTSGVWVSSDYGVTFALVSFGLSCQIRAVKCDYSGKYVLATSQSGNVTMYSVDFGSSWTNIYGNLTTSLQYWSCAIGSSSTGMNLFVGSNSSGIFYTTNPNGSSTSWTQISTSYIPANLRPGDIAISQDEKYMLTASSNSFAGHVYVSSDSGATWTNVTLSGSYPGGFSSVSMDATGQYMIACCYGSSTQNHFVYSTNYGVTWTDATNLESLTNSLNTCYITLDAGSAFAGKYGGYLYRAPN
jgi:hypothetical protein